jgi:hypothetical protein
MFNRDFPPQFRAACAHLEPQLQELGFILASESFFPDSFGSAHVEYTQGKRGPRLRLVFDGKDAALWLQASPGRGNPVSWSPLEAPSTNPKSIPTVRHGGLNVRLAQLSSAVTEAFGPSSK